MKFLCIYLPLIGLGGLTTACSEGSSRPSDPDGSDLDASTQDASFPDGGDDGGEPLPFAPADELSVPDPMAWGPFPVGVITVDLLDESREDAAGGPRFLRTEVWYPAAPSARGQETWSYDLKREADDPHIDLGELGEGFRAAQIGPLESGAVRDAAIETGYGPYPLILLSHGAYSTRFHYTYHTAHLASHGYVVAAPDHAGNTLWDMIRDGMDLLAAAATLPDRVADLVFVRDQLVASSQIPGQLLAGQLDTTGPAGVSGHSLGGLTALMAAGQDEGFSFALAMAPPTEPVVLAMVGVQPELFLEPAMILGSVTDQTLPYRTQYCAYRALGSTEKYLFELEGGGHFSFSDACRIEVEAPTDIEGAPNKAEDGCDPADVVPFETAQEAINAYGTAFYNRYLRHSGGSQAYLVDRDEPPFDVVTFYVGNNLPDWPDGCP